MFHSLARKAMLAAKPVRMSGVDFTNVSPDARALPNAPCNRLAKADRGFAPARAKRSPDKRMAPASAVATLVTRAVEPISGRRSIRQPTRPSAFIDGACFH